jgi:hypothetical protein
VFDMLGRLLKLFLLLLVAYGLVRWLFTSRQKAVLHEWVSTLALALLITSVLAAGWYWYGRAG